MGNETSSNASTVIQQIQTNVEQKWDQLSTAVKEQNQRLQQAKGNTDVEQNGTEEGDGWNRVNGSATSAELEPRLSSQDIEGRIFPFLSNGGNEC